MDHDEEARPEEASAFSDASPDGQVELTRKVAAVAQTKAARGGVC